MHVPEENAHSIDLPSSSTNSHTVHKKISHSQHSEVEVIVLVRSSSTILTQRNSSAVYGWLVEIKLIIMHAPEDDALPVIEHEQEAVQILRQQHSAVIVSVVA
jgi:hypothetical protein